MALFLTKANSLYGGKIILFGLSHEKPILSHTQKNTIAGIVSLSLPVELEPGPLSIGLQSA